MANTVESAVETTRRGGLFYASVRGPNGDELIRTSRGYRDGWMPSAS